MQNVGTIKLLKWPFRHAAFASLAAAGSKRFGVVTSSRSGGAYVVRAPARSDARWLSPHKISGQIKNTMHLNNLVFSSQVTRTIRPSRPGPLPSGSRELSMRGNH